MAIKEVSKIRVSSILASIEKTKGMQVVSCIPVCKCK